MPGLFSAKSSIQFDITLILQIIILIILIISFKHAKDKKIRTHGLEMAIVVILHTASIFLVMLPSALINYKLLISAFDLRVTLTWIHIAFGASAEALGVFLVTAWRFNPKYMIYCMKIKKLMLPTFVIWAFSLVLGIAIYVNFYL